MYRPRAWVERQRTDRIVPTWVHAEYQPAWPERFAMLCEINELTAVEEARDFATVREFARRSPHITDSVIRWHPCCT
jgi:hypothetical protein